MPKPDPPRTLSSFQGREFQLGGSRVPWCLRKRAHGADLEGYLRGSDKGKLRQGAGRLCLRQRSKAGTTEWPTILGSRGWTDHVERIHMTRARTLQAAGWGSVGTMNNWRYIALHAM